MTAPTNRPTPTSPPRRSPSSAGLTIAGAILLAAIVAAPFDLAHLGLPDISQIRHAIATRHLPAQLAIGLAGIAGWIAWAWITTTIAAELLDRLHHHPPRRRLLADLAAPVVTVLVALSARAAPSLLRVSPAAAATTPTTTTTRPPASPLTTHDPPERSTPIGLAYVVKPGDNLWDIAIDLYGDGHAFERIWHATPGLADPRVIHPGQTLAIPTDGLLPTAHQHLTKRPLTANPDDTITVEPGDNLWTIAQARLGDGTQWTEIWATNVGRAEPNGHLDNPDLLRPGWQLDVPATNGHPANPVPKLSTARPEQAQPPTPPADDIGHTPTPQAARPPPATRELGQQPRLSVQEPSRPTHQPPSQPADTTTPPARALHHPPTAASGWDLPRLASEGTVLVGAAAIGILGLRHRLRQHTQQHLPDGHRSTPTPAEAHPATAAIRVEAQQAQPDHDTLTAALGQLETAVAAWPPADRPWLVGIRTQAHQAQLVFDSPTMPAPTPFTQATPNTWTLTNPEPPPEPPGPGLIICAGWQGPWWIWLDLAAPAHIGLTGPHAEATARRWAAELAGSPLAEGARITTIGIDLPGTRPQTAPQAQQELADWNTDADRDTATPWWGDPDRPPAELLLTTTPLDVPKPLGRGLAVIGLNQPDAQLVIDTRRPVANLGELGDTQLIHTPNQVQTAVEGELHRSQTTTPHPTPSPPSRSADWPDGDIRVRILGPVTIETTTDKPRRAVLQLAAYLAAHPQGARRDRWATAVWPDTRLNNQTIRNRIFDLRRTLGATNTITTQNGIDQLTCPTDWTRYHQHLADDNPHAALALVSGEPLADLDAEWPYAEDAPATHIQATIANTAINHAQTHLPHNPTETEWAARQGLLASPNDHRLWVLLLKSLTKQGRQAEARKILQRLDTTDTDLADDELAAAAK